MTNKEAIDILIEFNNWRRGLGKTESLSMTGKTIGEAIDHAILSLNKLEVDTSKEHKKWTRRKIRNDENDKDN